MERYSIYILIDPRDTSIRYVGKTKEKLYNRLSKHINDAKRVKNNRRVSWIRKLTKLQLKPIMEEIDVCYTHFDSCLLECMYIGLFRSWGFSLLNATNGGEGTYGYKHTKESMDKIIAANRESALKRSPLESRKKRMSLKEQAIHNSILRSIPVYQFDKNFKLVKKWESAKSAAEYYGGGLSGITNVTNGRSKIWRGFYWSKTETLELTSIKLVTLIGQINTDHITIYRACQLLNVGRSKLMTAIHKNKEINNTKILIHE